MDSPPRRTSTGTLILGDCHGEANSGSEPVDIHRHDRSPWTSGHTNTPPRAPIFLETPTLVSVLSRTSGTTRILGSKSESTPPSSLHDEGWVVPGPSPL